MNYGYSLIRDGSYIQDYDKLIQSLFLRLTTPLGSIPRRPTFGSRLKELLFDNIIDKNIMEERIRFYVLETFVEEVWLEIMGISTEIDVDANEIKVIMQIMHKENGAVLETYFRLSN